MKWWLLAAVALAATTSPAGVDDFEQSLNVHWITSRPARVHTIDSGDPGHGRLLALDPDGDDVYALVKDTEGWAGGAIEGDVRFTSDEDSYLGLIYNFRRTAARTDFGVIYLKGNESDAQANPHDDFNVSRTLYPEFRVPLGGAAAIRTGQWQHFKLEVIGTRAHLYVGDMTTPQLTFAMFGGESGALGLQSRSVGGTVWIDNVTWRPLSTLSYSGPDRPAVHYVPQQMLTSWSVAGPLTEVDDEIARQPDSGRRWRPFAADPRGAVMTGTVTTWAFFAALDGVPTPDELIRMGRYGEAAHVWTEMLRTMPADDPKRPDLENRRALYASLVDVPPQQITVDGGGSMPLTRNVLGTLNVPVDVGGHRASWIFDTGANLSTVTRSEAEALGLKTRESGAYVRGSTGAKNPLHLAVAPQLRVGPATLTNVVFLVLSDEALYVTPMRYQIRGILGMPALHALGAFSVSADGDMRIEASSRASGRSNIRFDGWSPIVEVTRAGHRLQLLLDTGANVTTLSLSARTALSAEELATLTDKVEQSGGAGGGVIRTIDVLPTLRLEIGDGMADLHNVSLPRAPDPDATDRDGVLGIDALREGFTIDFRSMRLTTARAPKG